MCGVNSVLCVCSSKTKSFYVCKNACLRLCSPPPVFTVLRWLERQVFLSAVYSVQLNLRNRHLILYFIFSWNSAFFPLWSLSLCLCLHDYPLSAHSPRSRLFTQKSSSEGRTPYIRLCLIAKLQRMLALALGRLAAAKPANNIAHSLVHFALLQALARSPNATEKSCCLRQLEWL